MVFKDFLFIYLINGGFECFLCIHVCSVSNDAVDRGNLSGWVEALAIRSSYYLWCDPCGTEASLG